LESKEKNIYIYKKGLEKVLSYLLFSRQKEICYTYTGTVGEIFCIMVPASGKQLLIVCWILQPLRTLWIGMPVPTTAAAPSAPLSDKPLQTPTWPFRG